MQAREQRISGQQPTWTEQHAQTAQDLHDAYPWIEPNVVALFASQGVTVGSPLAERAAQLSAAWQMENTADWVDPGHQVAPKVPPSGVGGVLAAIDEAAPMLSDINQMAMAVNPKAWATGGRETVRRAFSLAEWPIRSIQGALNEALTARQDPQHDFGDFRGTSQVHPGRQMVEAIRDPDWRLGDVDLGEGVLPAGQAYEHFEMTRRQFAERHHADITEAYEEPEDRFVTPGRLVARHQLGFDPNTTAFERASGIMDAISVIALDPVAWASAGASKAAHARKVFGGARGLRAAMPNTTRALESVGVLPHKKMTAAQDFEHFIRSQPEGRILTRALKNETSFDRIWRNILDKKIPAYDARRLRDATTEEEVVHILRSLVDTGLMRERPGAWGLTAGLSRSLGGALAGDAGAATGAWQQARHSKAVQQARLIQWIPPVRHGKRGISLDNIDHGLEDFDRIMKIAKLGQDRVSHYTEAFVDAAATGNAWRVQHTVVGAYKEMATGILNQELGGALTRGGMKLARFSNKDIERIFAKTPGFDDSYRKYWINEMTGEPVKFAGARTTMVEGVEHAQPTPSMLTEYDAMTIPIPAYRELRRAISPFAAAMAHRDTLPSNVTRWLIDGMSWTMARAFQPSMLLTRPVAWVTRIAAETQGRIAMEGLDGLLTHPWAYMNWAAGTRGIKNVHLRRLPTEAEVPPDTVRIFKKYGIELERGDKPVGRGFAGIVDDDLRHMTEHFEAMNRSKQRLAGYGVDIQKQLGLNDWDTVFKTDPRATTAWARQLSQFWNEPVQWRIWGGLSPEDLASIKRPPRPSSAMTPDAPPGRGVPQRTDVGELPPGTPGELPPLGDDLPSVLDATDFLPVRHESLPGMRGTGPGAAGPRAGQHQNADPHSMEALLDWLMYGSGRRYLHQHAQQSREKARLAHDREFLRQYVEEAYIQQVQEATRGNPELLEAIGTGVFRGMNVRGMNVTGQIDPAIVNFMRGEGYNPRKVQDLQAGKVFDKQRNRLMRSLREMQDEYAPHQIPMARDVSKRGGQTMGQQWDTAMDRMFWVMFAKWDDTFARSPVWRQLYWQRGEEMLEHSSYAARRHIIARAKEANLGKARIKRMEQAARDLPPGPIDDPTVADTVAKVHAFEQTKKLLYDISERGNFSSILAGGFPFLEAWREILTTWGRQLAKKPVVLHRANLALGGAEGTGYVFEDDHGAKMFRYPGGEILSNLGLGGQLADGQVEIPLTGRLSGMNLIGNFTPGGGPWVAWPADRLLDEQDPRWRGPREFLMPFGAPRDFASSWMPAWMDKMITGLSKDPASRDHLYESTRGAMTQALAATGNYTNEETGMADSESLTRLVEDAERYSLRLYRLRAAAQAFMPTGPSTPMEIEADNGQMFTIDALAKHMAELKDEHGFDEGFLKFVEEFGWDLAATGIPRSHRVATRSVEREGWEWEQEHKHLHDDFFYTLGYFAPVSAGPAEMDLVAYSQQFDTDTRQRYTPEQWAMMRNHTLGWMAYNHFENQLVESGVNLDAWQGQRLLSAKREELRREYPGFDRRAVPGLMQRADLAQEIEELEQVFDHPDLLETPQGDALAEYLRRRGQVNEVARTMVVNGRPLSDMTRANAARPLREYLREYGDELAHRVPQFQGMWEQVLRRELEVYSRDEMLEEDDRMMLEGVGG